MCQGLRKTSLDQRDNGRARAVGLDIKDYNFCILFRGLPSTSGNVKANKAGPGMALQLGWPAGRALAARTRMRLAVEAAGSRTGAGGTRSVGSEPAGEGIAGEIVPLRERHGKQGRTGGG